MRQLTASDARRIVGGRTLELRTALGWTQEILAERLGWSPRQVQKVEAGEANLRLDRLVELAVALGADLRDLLTPLAANPQRRVGRPRK